MYKCMKCDSEMLTNSFVCKKCEYVTGRENDKTNGRRLVQALNLPTDQKEYDVIEIEESSNKGNETSPYWNHQERAGIRDEDGSIVENAYANTDVVGEISGETQLNGRGTKRWSKCALCKGRVHVAKRDGGVRKFVHDDSCWSVFKGQMLKETVN